MLNKVKKSKSEGFTIIEVMIVLAIAGLILLIVFLAVPSLQRNSRNTQRKNDAAGIAAAGSTIISNSNGKLPVGLGNNAAADNNRLDVCSAGGNTSTAGTTACTANSLETANLGFYQEANIKFSVAPLTGALPTITVVPDSTTPTATSINVNSVTMMTRAKCDDTTPTSPDSSPRGAIVLYVTESSSGNGTLQCVEA